MCPSGGTDCPFLNLSRLEQGRPANRNDEPSINPATPCPPRQVRLSARRICYFQRRTSLLVGQANQGIRISKKSGQPQFHHGELRAPAWHRGTSTGSFPSPSQGKLCSLLSPWT